MIDDNHVMHEFEHKHSANTHYTAGWHVRFSSLVKPGLVRVCVNSCTIVCSMSLIADQVTEKLSICRAQHHANRTETTAMQIWNHAEHYLEEKNVRRTSFLAN
jgi:hypothetical protein